MGAIAIAVLAVLVLIQRLDPFAAGLAALAIVLAGAATVIASDRSAEERFRALAEATRERGGEAPPYSALINVLPDPILVIAATEPDDLTSRRYLFANSAARNLLRMERGEGLLVSVIRDPGVLDAVDQALFAGRDVETVYETVGAQARTLRADARPLGLAFDGQKLALLVFRDETEARQVERTRVDFLANASHELRTPLASLSGFIETLRGHARDDEGARDRFLGIMQVQADRMRRLIDDLMSLSRIELNEHIAPADHVDLALCIRDVLDALTPLAAERGVRLDADLPERGVARVVGDRDQITQVAQNLIDNALKYSATGGAVRIEVAAGLSAEVAAQPRRPEAVRLALLTPDRSDETYAVVRVSDDGPGIARGDLPRLTERFYRVEGQKSGERNGTGLGLAIVKHIANRHRGGLAVESASGVGTTFTAYFPLAATPVVPAPEPVVKVL